ncbi:hypothetical protein QTH25_13600 [Clostridium perfringens]|uniref:hypothetical protein n=1 Tax=Clostridium perfringens TaxID=1502 RepID=UPI00339005AC|nr:hypothetical protein [Clostridium perfringens]
MTCIIGYKDKKNNKVYIGADSCVGNSLGKHTLGENYKIFKPSKNKNILIAMSGSVRALQVLKYQMDFPSENELIGQEEEFNEKYIVTKIIPKLQRVCDDQKVLEKDWVCLYFLIAYKDKLWKISGDFAVLEYTDEYLSEGSGFAYAEGSLHTTKDMDMSIEDKILMGLKAGCIDKSVAPPFFILNTKDDEVIKKEN